MIEAFKRFENLFSDPPYELMSIVSIELIAARASVSVGSALQIGQSQCKAIAKVMLNAVNTKRTSLYATIRENKLTLFRCKAAVIVSKLSKLQHLRSVSSHV